MKKLSFFLLIFLSVLKISASTADTTTTAEDTSALTEMDLARLDTFYYQKTGNIMLGQVATLNIPAGFKYLNGSQASSVLHNVWRNPYAETLGMIVPSDLTVFSKDCWAVVITYEEEGHVKDDDAKDIKYNELLSQMQKEVKESNDERVKQGGRAIELTGWAETPYYDAAAHKLYWAKKLRDVGDTAEFLNYNIRVLGRKGVLVLNAIGDLDQLAEIKRQTPAILEATNFSQGNTYSEFNSSVDKVAAYGIAGLIAGGILAKTGLLAKIGILLLKFLKPLLVALGGIGAYIMRFFKGRREGN